MKQTSGEGAEENGNARTYGVSAAIPVGGDTVTEPFCGPDGNTADTLAVLVNEEPANPATAVMLYEKPLWKQLGGKYTSDDHICTQLDFETKNVVTIALEFPIDELFHSTSAPSFDVMLHSTVTSGVIGEGFTADTVQDSDSPSVALSADSPDDAMLAMIIGEGAGVSDGETLAVGSCE